MAVKKPWEPRWKIRDSLREGGQGHTFLVEELETQNVAVLKRLKNTGLANAKLRMDKEVHNLKLLHKAGVAVPEVIDSNMETDQDVRYFVMEFVEGASLADTLKERNKLALDEARNITSQLLDISERAQELEILHRDIKPENILLGPGHNSKVVMVDYGLSFNFSGDDDLTKVDEPMGNNFLRLPENTRPGGSNRDLRSDLTGIVAVFYFCLTGKSPGMLLDEENLKPHKRQGYSIAEFVDEPEQIVTQLNALFDRGFEQKREDRFQNVDELRTRLAVIGRPEADVVDIDPAEVIKEVAEYFRYEDEETVLERTRTVAKLFLDSLANVLLAIFKAATAIEYQYFSIARNASLEGLGRPPQGGSVLAMRGFVVQFQKRNITKRGFVYALTRDGKQCTIHRAFFIATEVSIQPTTTGKSEKTEGARLQGEWEPLDWYDSDTEQIGSAIVTNDVKKSFGAILNEMKEEVLGS